MGAPYPLELRERAIAAIDSGMSKWQVHKMFKISRSTLDDWLMLRARTGSLRANSNYQRGPKPTIEDNDKTRVFFDEHKHKTLKQLCDAWYEETGQRLSDVTMSTSLKRLGYTRKKELSLSRA